MDAKILSKSFWTSRAGAMSKTQTRRGGMCVEYYFFFIVSGRRNGAALRLSHARLLAAHAGVDLLADDANDSLGIYQPISGHQQFLGGAGLRRAARRCAALGRDVPRPAGR